MGESIRKLCPKNYAWFIDDCNFGQDCSDCELDEAPIKLGDISNKEKDAIHELIKIYSKREG